MFWIFHLLQVGLWGCVLAMVSLQLCWKRQQMCNADVTSGWRSEVTGSHLLPWDTYSSLLILYLFLSRVKRHRSPIPLCDFFWCSTRVFHPHRDSCREQLRASTSAKREISTKPVKELRMLRGAASCSHMRAKLPKILFHNIWQRRCLRREWGFWHFMIPIPILTLRKMRDLFREMRAASGSLTSVWWLTECTSNIQVFYRQAVSRKIWDLTISLTIAWSISPQCSLWYKSLQLLLQNITCRSYVHRCRETEHPP